MFDSLSSKLQNAFKNLRGLGKISESNVADALREVRMALLEADVNFKVARDFIERVKTKSLGAEVIASVQPGQQIIKFVSDELVALLGSQNAGAEPFRPAQLPADGRPAWLRQNHLVRQARAAAARNRAARRCWWRRTCTVRRRWINWKRSANKSTCRCSSNAARRTFLKIAREALDFARANNRNIVDFRHRRPLAD